MAVLSTGADKCPFCGLSVDKHDPTTWHLVRGWVTGVKKDSMTMREYDGYYAHNACIKKVKAGQAPDQPSMLDEPDATGLDSSTGQPDLKIAEDIFDGS